MKFTYSYYDLIHSIFAGIMCFAERILKEQSDKSHINNEYHEQIQFMLHNRKLLEVKNKI